MKTSIQILIYAAVLTSVSSGTARGQGAFENLDFESAKIVLVDLTPYNVASSNALPGWTASSGTSPLAVIPYNLFTATPAVGLYGSNSYAISGNFSVWVSYGGTISQTGSVPLSARSLLLKQGSGIPFYPVVPLGLTLGGTSLSSVAVASGANYVLYGADISAFAGQTDTLTISGGGFIDDIIFSPDPVPEPDTPILFSIGMVVFAIRWWRYLAGRQG